MRPSMILASTLLPQPEPPTRETISSSAMEKLTSSTACTCFLPWPKVQVTFFAEKTDESDGVCTADLPFSDHADFLFDEFAVRLRDRAAFGEPATGDGFCQVRRR